MASVIEFNKQVEPPTELSEVSFSLTEATLTSIGPTWTWSSIFSITDVTLEEITFDKNSYVDKLCPIRESSMEKQTFCPYYELLDYEMFTYANDSNPRLLADEMTNGDCRKTENMDATILGTEKKVLCFPRFEFEFDPVDLAEWSEGRDDKLNFGFTAEVPKEIV